MSVSQKIAYNTLISYAGRIISSAFALVAIGLITRSLGQEGFGAYTTSLAFLSLFVILADLGLQSLMTREISKATEGIDEIASNFFTLRLITSLVFLLAGAGLVFVFPYTQEIKIGASIGAFGFFFLSLSQLLLSVFQKQLAMHMAAIAEVAGRGAQLLFVYLIYVLYIGDQIPYSTLWGIGSPTYPSLFLFIGAMSAASFIIFFLSFLFARKYVRIRLSFDGEYWMKIVKTTWPIALSIVLTLVYFKIDTIFLSLMKPQADVGIYGVAYRVLESLLFFPAMFAGIIMPILSRDAVSNLSHFRDVFRKSFRAIAIFAAPVVGGGVVLSYSIVNLIGGHDFLAAGAPMQALFIAAGIIFFGNILGRAVIALDLQKKAVCAYLLGMALNIVLNLIFIPKYTYMGAAWTTVVTEFMITVFLLWLVWRKTKVSIDVGNITKAAFSAAVMSGALLFFLALRSPASTAVGLGEGGISPITTPLSFSLLGAVIILGAGIYFGTLYLIKGVSKEEILAIFRK